jgi:hypothetical protein
MVSPDRRIAETRVLLKVLLRFAESFLHLTKAIELNSISYFMYIWQGESYPKWSYASAGFSPTLFILSTASGSGQWPVGTASGTLPPPPRATAFQPHSLSTQSTFQPYFEPVFRTLSFGNRKFQYSTQRHLDHPP